MKSSLLLLVLLLFFLHFVSGQESDTISISGITISASRVESHSGFKQSTIDTIALKRMGYQSMNDLLSKHSPVFIKTYGQGNLATASFRGTSASHTKVLWNGMEINNPMLGQSDFSQIPVALIDDVSISYGGAGISKSSGSLGGSVTLSNQPEWEDKFRAAVTQHAGSFDTYYTTADLKAGNKKFLSRSRFIYGNSDNNYKYLDNFADRENPPLEERKNAGFNSSGMLQELYYRDKQKNVFSAKVWGQKHFREIAPPLGVTHTTRNETQSNESFRALVNWGRQHGDVSMHAVSGFVYDFLHYKNNLSEINSRNYSHRFHQSAGIRFRPSSAFSFHSELKYTNTRVSSNNYFSDKQRDDFTAFAGATYFPADRWSARLSFRQKIVDGQLLPIIPSLGVDYQLLQEKKLMIKANASRNYRLPSLNDLYWHPGGNPDLHPEKGIALEAGLTSEWTLHPTTTLAFGATGYRNAVDNWIAWQPDTLMSYWTPGNIKEVVSQGVESDFTLSFRSKPWLTVLHVAYNYTNATVEESGQGNAVTGRQLVYIPKHSLQSSLHVSYQKNSLDLVSRYTGKRFTTSDNTSSMPAFYTTDVVVRRKMIAGEVEGSLMVKVNNLFNENYQVMAWYPMPRRNYMLALKIQLNNL